MILGRAPSLFIAVFAAAMNVIIFVFGVHLDGVQVAALNGFAFAVIALVAGTPLTDHAALTGAARERANRRVRNIR